MPQEASLFRLLVGLSSEASQSPHSINRYEAIEARLMGTLMKFGTWADKRMKEG